MARCALRATQPVLRKPAQRANTVGLRCVHQRVGRAAVTDEVRHARASERVRRRPPRRRGRHRRPGLSTDITTTRDGAEPEPGTGQPDPAEGARPARSIRVWVRRILFVALVGFTVWALVANRTEIA